ncbi:MAG TPA: hypothetical protein VMR37_03530 [Rhabdochlamydiaceae bacterium]|jgi:hypothetical protein|nr:hypothetical protein [Rhabdochlamydiaceae bacterium]
MTDRASPYAHDRSHFPPAGRGSARPNNGDLQRVIGGALMLVGAIFTLYGAGSGLSTLVSISLDNFGLLCLTGIISCIFFSCIATPLGALLINGMFVGGAVLLFGGLPALPGALIAGGGAFVYFSA